MGSADVSIAATALAISLVAFMTAFGQLLQQYFATAEGFETLYTTPELFIASGEPERPEQILIEGGFNSRAATLAPAPQPSQHGIRQSNELVCWISLLHQLHLAGARNGTSDTPGISLPALVFQERSWDFQVPDVVRPLAVCSVSDIAILGRRLGMRWKDFRPYDGSLKAEGHFQVMSSTNVRSLGILLQYNFTWKESWRPAYRFGMIRGLTKQKEERYIPSTRADLLGFGIISGSAGIHIPRFALGTQDEVMASLSLLDETGESTFRLRALLQQNSAYYLRTGDLVAMTMEMARLRGRSHVQVPAPSENMSGFSTSPKGRQAFRLCLEKYVSNGNYAMGPQTQVVLSACQHLSSFWKEWETDAHDPAEATEIPMRLLPDYLDAVHDHYDKLKPWIIHQKGPIYRKILGAHIRHAIFRENGETSLLNFQKSSPDYEADIEAYFAIWPAILEDLSSGKDEYHAKILFDTWVVMLFRACCWNACHFFVPGERVPSEFYGSQLPVYIG
ncbi:hypothetical protein LSUE1_G001851 [Lachnellula suecica]|uniref:Uncharacterized protein n=1 Tax=Lachnellula suecica TaxID=602035 RepID=A0A8T9CL80_9HELO|nr:hypothetical protein LSUE1_G001851 [Lachnellula suecica]